MIAQTIIAVDLNAAATSSGRQMEVFLMFKPFPATRKASCDFGEKARCCCYRVRRLSRFTAVLFISLLCVPNSVAVAQLSVSGYFSDIQPVPADPLYVDYNPTVTADGLMMIFTNACGWEGGPPCRPGHVGAGFDLFMATRTNTEEPFGNISNLGSPVNSSNAENFGSLSPTGETLYFGAHNRGFGIYDLYQATRRDDGTFANVENLGAAVNGPGHENQSSISATGLTIYYTKGPDFTEYQRLWSATRSSTDLPFGEAQDLGDALNGDGVADRRSRLAPSISSDELFLFVSIDEVGDGQPWWGDIWVSTRASKDDPFGAPININELWPGTEINTDSDDVIPFISRDWPAPGSKLYFTSNQASGEPGDFDIYQATWITAKGDFNSNGVLDAEDIDLLSVEISNPAPSRWFDLNGDGLVDADDHEVWVHDLKNTWFGDADLSGEFNSSDMVQVFAAGKYETGESSGWANGDWDGNGFFDSSDMITAFADGGYEKGLRMDATAVPEPEGIVLALAATCLVLVGRRARQKVPLLLPSTTSGPFFPMTSTRRQRD